MKTYSFEVKSEPEEDGRWSAWLASYPACAAWGYTRHEALDALADMTVVFLEVMSDAGEPVYADSVEPPAGYEQMTAAMVDLGSKALAGTASVSNETIRIPVPA